MDSTNNSQAVPAGILTDNELRILKDQTEKSIKSCKTTIKICLFLFWLIVPLIIAGLRAETLKNMQVRLRLLQQGNVPVHRVQGELKLKNAGDTALFIYVGDYLLPQISGSYSDYKSGLNDLKGQTITFEFLPTLRINRSFSDGSNKGYNFIEKSHLGNH